MIRINSITAGNRKQDFIFPTTTVVERYRDDFRTEILDAAAASLMPFLEGLGCNYEPVKTKERVSASGTIQEKRINWSVSDKNFSEACEVLKNTDNWRRRLMTGDNGLILPALFYYKKERCWERKNKSPILPNYRQNGYIQALDAGFFDLFNDWFFKMKNLEIQTGKKVPQLGTVLEALRYCFNSWTGIQELEVSFNPLTGVSFSKADYNIKERDLEFTYPGGHLTYKLSEWNKDFRYLACLAADMACRIMMLNPQLSDKALEETGGVIIIDNVNLNINRDYGKKITRDLAHIFPKIQFIVTYYL